YPSDAPVIKLSRAVALGLFSPGPTYSLPMGMGVMRVGVGELGVTQHRIYHPVIITGVQVDFTTRWYLTTTGHLV
ncbi:hypothetical protein IKG12_02085, partial [Candidatus Saccharibacteria bacterium]|nr:hypothetical protein [Candidatus Saccharibacteria bacterium]